MTDALIEAVKTDLLERGINPDLAEAVIKQQIPGGADLPEIVKATDFLALTMRVGYLKAVETVRARMSLLELEHGVQAFRTAHSIQPVIDAAHIMELADEFKPTATDTMRGSYMRGAREGSSALKKVNINVRFDMMNPKAAEWAQRNAARLVTSISDSQREAVRNIVTSSVNDGRTVGDIARDIRHMVGLRPDQVNALSKYRDVLSARNLNADQVEKKMAKYANALARQRGELIARTEVLSAANAGQTGLWQKAKADGLLQATAKKVWITTPDELLCPECEALDEVAVGLNDSWESDGASVMFPPLHPNCRCSQGLSQD